MASDLTLYLAAAGVALALAAFWIGRASAGGARRRELESQLSDSRDEQARLVSETESLRSQLSAEREAHDAYRLDVVDHFSGTSDLLRDLTVQYRSVYEHLTKGASTLCPEGFVGLTEGLPKPELAGAPPDLEVDETEKPADSADVSRDPNETTRPLSV
jgi:uncharacterized membrane-anchored protein YhcB (DUF1043 family)